MDLMDLLILLLLALQTPALAIRREFHFVSEKKTFTEAKSYCREKFLDLVTIEGIEDWARVTEMVRNGNTWMAWVGLYDDMDSWRWSLDDTSLNEREYGNWFSFDQNNEMSRQHCVDASNNGQLHDNECNTAEGSVCYDDATDSYILVTDPKTWQEAQSYCRQTYTDLASIRNQQEWDDVMGAITTAGNHWIGLFREGWQWCDGSTSSFRMWSGGQPTGGNEVCAGATAGGMHDINCNSKFPFICSVAQWKLLKVTLKIDGSVNLNDPIVQEAVLKQMEEELRGQGVDRDVRSSWRKQPNGDIFNKTEP